MPPKTRTFKNGKYDYHSTHKTIEEAKKEATKIRDAGRLAGVVKHTSKKDGDEFVLYTRDKAPKKEKESKKGKTDKKGKKGKKGDKSDKPEEEVTPEETEEPSELDEELEEALEE